jgi:SH3-like domain-containing protein
MGPDTLFTELDRQGNWSNIRLRNGETGWAYSSYIACCKPAQTGAAGTGSDFHYLVGLDPGGDNWLALRSEPNMRGVQLLRMGPQTLLTVIGRDGAWLNVRLRTGETGWAYSAFIACCRRTAAR